MRRLDEHPYYGFAMALLTALMWGVLPVVFTLLRGGPDVKAVTWIRFAFSAVVVWLFLWQRGKLPALAGWQLRDWVSLAFAVFFFSAVLAGRSPKFEKMRRRAGMWNLVLIVLLTAIVAIGGYLKVAHPLAPAVQPPAATPPAA